MSTALDFRELKSRVSFEAVLAHYGITLKKKNASAYRGDCPLPMHKDSKNTFSVDNDKGIWSCQSATCIQANWKKAKRGGDLLDFILVMERLDSIRAAAERLNDLFPASSVSLTPRQPSSNDASTPTANTSTISLTDDFVLVDPETPAVNKPLPFELKGIQHDHPYLASRGFSKELCERYGVGFFGGHGSMSGRVVFPLHDHDGVLVGYAGRAIGDGAHSDRWRFPAGILKSQLLWNYHRLRSSRAIAVVVESFWGALRVHDAGYPVVALMGATASEWQLSELATFSRIVTLLDADEAGAKGSAAMCASLAQRTYVRNVSLPGQPDHYTSDQLRKELGAL